MAGRARHVVTIDSDHNSPSQLTTIILGYFLVVPKCMLSITRPSFEVVKGGWILYNLKDFTRLNLVASGTFSGDDQERWLFNDGYSTRDLKNDLIGKSGQE